MQSEPLRATLMIVSLRPMSKRWRRDPRACQATGSSKHLISGCMFKVLLCKMPSLELHGTSEVNDTWGRQVHGSRPKPDVVQHWTEFW
jgi:hypothetical protein